MKKYLFPLIVFAFLAAISCEEKTDIEKEKQAILAVLQEQGEASAAMNLDRLFPLYVQDSLATRLQTRKNDYTIYTGWDKIQPLFEDYKNSGSTRFENMKNSKENMILKVMDESAWLICDNIWKWTSEGKPGSQNNIEITFLEKIDGKWKISFTAFITKPEPEENE